MATQVNSITTRLEQIVRRYEHSWTDIELEAQWLADREGISQDDILDQLYALPSMKALGYTRDD